MLGGIFAYKKDESALRVRKLFGMENYCVAHDLHSHSASLPPAAGVKKYADARLYTNFN
jgi:hypothetical protein